MDVTDPGRLFQSCEVRGMNDLLQVCVDTRRQMFPCARSPTKNVSVSLDVYPSFIVPE